MNLRAIQSHLSFRRVKAKCFAVVLVVVTLVVVIIDSKFDLANPMFTKMCNANGYAMNIIDEAVTQQKIPSVEAVNDPHFRSFITSVRDHILSKFVGAMPCQKNSDEEQTISLIFVRLPLVTSGDEPIAPAPSLDAPQSDLTCRLDSPWARLAVRRSTSPTVRAVFIWNERQFLLDQVLLSGKSHANIVPLTPLSNRLFEQYATDYADSEILRSPRGESSHPTPPISERIPADVLWLFRNSWQSTRGPFSGIARSAMRTTLERAASGYTDLTKALIDQCFASAKTEIRYKSVLDLKNIFTLDQYRINQLH